MIIMAVDFGDSRTGLAICGKSELIASPIGVISEKVFDKIERTDKRSLYQVPNARENSG